MRFITQDKYVIRFTITSQRTTIKDLEEDWKEVQTTTTDILEEEMLQMNEPRLRVPLAGMYQRPKLNVPAGIKNFDNFLVNLKKRKKETPASDPVYSCRIRLCHLKLSMAVLQPSMMTTNSTIAFQIFFPNFNFLKQTVQVSCLSRSKGLAKTRVA